ncbi:MAG: hypothetical protein J5640_01300 [Bacteroidales bacterium]|nr:hypothetical protein [Bacteroidales bacterium]
MKKYFILAAAAVAAMAACTKSELDINVAPDTKIGFEVANYAAQTKANVALTNDEDGLYQFHTYAYQFPKLGDAVEFMNTDIFAWDNASTPAKVTSGTGIYSWAPENDYFWPKTGWINFYSYAGSIAPVESVSADKKTVTLTYTDKTILSDSNIMVADAALRFNANQSTYAVDGTETSGHVTTGVPTLFRHMLSKLYIDVKIQIPAEKKSANTIWKVEVLDSYDIDGDASIADTEKSLIIPVNKGSLTLTNADALAADAALNTTTQQWTRKADYTTSGTPDADVVSGWKPGDTTELIQLHQGTVLTLPVNATESTATEQLLAWRVVMPQLTDNVAFKLIYKVQALHDSTVFMEEIRTVGIDAAADIHDLTGSIASWESNKKITYHIIIDPVSEKVTFDPAVENYDPVEANADDVININQGGIVTP